jgi:hypothetical protein
MKKILLLHDEAKHPAQLLRNTLPAKFLVGETEAVVGCNCDRWGHPCPSCVERIAQPAPEFPISMPAKEMR